MKKSESVKEIAKALMIFSMKVEKINKTELNPFFKSKYAPLPDIIEAINVPLSESGLSVAQFPDGNALTTILMHESGEWLMASYPLNPVKNDPQGHGSAITYARRYALGAILNLSIDKDDDGNAASAVEYKHAVTVQKVWLNEKSEAFAKVVAALKSGKYTIDDVLSKYQISQSLIEKLSNLENEPA